MRWCECGHTSRQHELRAGGRLGCFIVGCLCLDFDDEVGDPVPTGVQAGAATAIVDGPSEWSDR